MSCIVGVDVGGTSTKAALATPSGRVLEVRRVPTPAPHGADGDVVGTVVETIDALVRALRHEAPQPVAALGVAVPGLVDDDRGVAVWSENLQWRDAPLREMLREATGLPVSIRHDVRAGALAESRLGAAREVEDAVFLPVGTGIAAALIVGGRIHSGGGFAGEIGHVSTGRTDPCPCGGRGCLENLASAAAIARRYTEFTGEDVSGSADVLDRLRRGDSEAAFVWEDAVALLAWGVTLLVGVVAPQVVVVGGGLAEAGERLLAPLRENVESRLTFQRRPRIVASVLGDLAGCLGAALQAREHMEAAS